MEDKQLACQSRYIER